MLSYLSKFVLQMLPTITATVIGAYIVSTWINPKTPVAGATRMAVWPLNKLAEGSPKPAEPAPVAEATDDARPATGAEKVRVIPIVKQADGAAERAASTTAATTVPPDSPAQTQEHGNEHRDAAELARIAIQRLRGEADAAAAPHDAHVRPVTAVLRPQQRTPLASLPPPPAGSVSVLPVTGAPLATEAPPLPPAVTIMTPNPPPALDMRADEPAMAADRLVPPREVPAARNPLSLQAAAHRASESPSLANDVLSATKSFFRAISPQELLR